MAKAQVTQLFDEIGFDTVDLGPLTESWRIQPGTPGYGPRLDAEEMTAALASAVRPAAALSPSWRDDLRLGARCGATSSGTRTAAASTLLVVALRAARAPTAAGRAEPGALRVGLALGAAPAPSVTDADGQRETRHPPPPRPRPKPPVLASDGRPREARLSIPALGLERLRVRPYRGSPDDARGTRIQNGGIAASPYGPRGGTGPAGSATTSSPGTGPARPNHSRRLPRLRKGDEVHWSPAGKRYTYEIVGDPDHLVPVEEVAGPAVRGRARARSAPSRRGR